MLNSWKTIGIAVVVIVVAASAVAYIFTAGRGTQQETQVWWIASDPHLGNYPENLDSLRVSIEDVNNLGIADHAVILGDILNNSANYRDNFFQMMNGLNVESWHYVPGNHDTNQTTGENFFPLSYHGMDVLGIRFIFIFTENNTMTRMGGIMGDEQFTWFQNELILHKNQPEFVFSHQGPNQWNVWNNVASLIQSGEANIKAWFYGHLHRWVVDENFQTYNFVSVSDSSLDWAQNYNGVFMFLQREGDTVNITLKFRQHLNREWISVQTTDGRTIDSPSFSVNVA